MNYELHVSWTKPTDDIALFFNTPDVKRILKLERLRGNQEYPFVYFISYFNPKIGLTGSEDFSRPLYEILERDYHAIAKVSKEDMGKVIGKQGKVAKSIRTVMKSVSAKEGKRANIEFVD